MSGVPFPVTQEAEDDIGALNTRAVRTGQTYNSAVSKFNKFLGRQSRCAGKKFKDLTAEFCDSYPLPLMMSEFANYLFEETKCVNTSQTYLSGVFSEMKKQVPSSEFFSSKYIEDGKYPWYSSIWHGLRGEKTKKTHKEGKEVVKKAPSIGRRLINGITQALVNMNTPIAMQNSAQCAILWSAVGRASELSSVTWNSMNFDDRELDFHWKQQKTKVESPMRFPVDREHYAMCPIHSIGRYLITYTGSFKVRGLEDVDDDIRWLFPDCVRKSDGKIAEKLTAILQELKRRNLVLGMPDNPTVHGFKNGATEHMAFDVKLAHIEHAFRGGWKAQMKKHEGNQILYVNELLNVSAGGMSMHAYEAVLECPIAPNCECFITEESQDKVEAMIDMLFCRNDNHCLKKNGHLRNLAYVFYAVQLMRLEEYEVDVPQSIVIKAIYHEASRVNIDKQTLHKWGGMVKEAWLNRIDRILNIYGSRDILERAIRTMNKSSEMYGAMLKMNSLLSSLESKQAKLVFDMCARFDQQEKNIAALVTLVQTMQMQMVTLFNSGAISSSPIPTLTQAATSASVSSVSQATAATEAPAESRTMNEAMEAGPSENHLTVFNQGKIEDMAVENFAASNFIYGIKYGSGQPYQFELSDQKKCRFAKLNRYMNRPVSIADNARLEEIREEHNKVVPPEESDLHDEIRDIYTHAYDRLKLKMNAAIRELKEKGPPLKRSRRHAAGDDAAGAVVSKIQNIEKEKKNLSRELEVFFSDGKVTQRNTLRELLTPH